jgi:ankyrin repeat protein
MSASRSLPDAPNLDWLRKQAKRRLTQLRTSNPSARLADAQFDLAKELGFSSWRALKAHVESLTIDGRLLEAARNGDVATLTAWLDRQPEKLHVTTRPYEQSLLHVAAWRGHVAAVDLLLQRGLDVNTRDVGDNAYAMHFAAGDGHLEVVRHLADAGGDVVGEGDDHALEIIGWATCFQACHEEVAQFLVSRGARHHVFSAIAMNLGDEVRRIVAADPAALGRKLTRNEDYRMPLHHAVLKNRPEMVALLLELGADPLAADGSGFPAIAYATSPDADRRIIEAILARGGKPDLFTALALQDWESAARLWRETAHATDGVLHLMAKRNNVAAVKWLLDRGANPNALWSHWDSQVAPLHLAAAHGHAEIVRLLLAAGADPHIRDSKHDGDVLGWARFFRQPAIVDILVKPT